MRPLEPVSRSASRYHAQTSARGDAEIVVNAAKLAEYGRRLSGRREPLGRDSSLDTGWLPGMDSNSSSRHESAGHAIQPPRGRGEKDAAGFSRRRRGAGMVAGLMGVFPSVLSWT